MADTTSVQAQIDRMRAETEKQKTVNDSVKALLASNAASMTSLADQISQLKAQASSPGQAVDLQPIEDQLRQMADALESNDADLANAVTANTPAAGQQ